ncbi:MAG: class I SAM-dependent methyltransferase [Marinosulfonomonas sp.]|nr:class I SAM-dependent methyltransferase [Marinosulfonomonas sp.]
MREKIDTRAIGLDVGLSFTEWLTGAENLHYGLWDGLEVTAGNLRTAQDAYTTKLFKLLPKGKLRILDIGGGAGETARKLLELGHAVDIVVPSAFLAERCRANAPAAEVHECMFEDLQVTQKFDLCLFSESFQYIPADIALSKAAGYLDKGGEIIISDCFRSKGFKRHAVGATVGGGHHIGAFRKVLAAMPVKTLFEEDITASVAPSIDLEQGFFNVVGHAVTRIDDELGKKKRKTRWFLHRALATVMSKRKRYRLNQRLNEKTRTAAHFSANNVYLMIKLRPE